MFQIEMFLLKWLWQIEIPNFLVKFHFFAHGQCYYAKNSKIQRNQHETLVYHDHIWNIICIEFDNYISSNLALGKLESNGSRKRNFLEGFPTMMTTSMLCICISSFLLGWNIIEFPVETYKNCSSIFYWVGQSWFILEYQNKC